MSTTGERIKEARLRAGLTQSELAEKIGVKFSAIHKYENGLVVNLKRETIQALSDALDVKPSWLLCMEEETVSAEPGEEQTPGDRMLFQALRGATEEEKLQAAKIIEALRR